MFQSSFIETHIWKLDWKRMFKLLISEEIEKFKKSKNKSWRNPKKHWLYKSKSERVREGAQQIHFHISGVGKIWSVRKWQKIDPGPLVGRGILVVIHPNSSKHYNSCMAWGGEQGKGGVEERDEKKEEKEEKTHVSVSKWGCDDDDNGGCVFYTLADFVFSPTCAWARKPSYPWYTAVCCRMCCNAS